MCDGEKDCNGGEDEENCIMYKELFDKESGFKVNTFYHFQFCFFVLKKLLLKN